MIGMLIAAAMTAAILLTGELLWRKQILKGEFARKFIHIIAASSAAFWPYFVERYQILLLSFIFIIALLVIKKYKLYRSLHSVERSTTGDIWYAASIGASAMIFSVDAIYTIAILHLALADGFAAIVGVSLKHRAKHFVFNGYTKSIAGTTTFILISFSLNVFYWMVASNYVLPISLSFYSLMCALILAFAEIASPKGSDNFIVPMLSGFLLLLPTFL